MKVLADIHCEDDEDIVIGKRKKTNSSTPSYDCIGGNMEYSTKVKGFDDLYAIIQAMSKQTAWLWWQLVKTRNRYNNESTYKAESQVDKRRLTVAYKELSKLDLVVRMYKKHYLINPLAMFPERDRFDEVRIKWDNLKGASNE